MMKKSVYFVALLLISLTVVFTSCGKDDDPEIEQTEELGSYKLKMDDQMVSEGSSPEVGMMGNNISISKGENFGIVLFGIPLNVGDQVELDDSNSPITITGKNLLLNTGDPEWYISMSGSMERTSKSKVKFEGVCQDITGNAHTFEGEVESDVFENI